jgi:WD40 repeat protein
MDSIRTIFAEALEIEDADERATFLARACGPDLSLRRDIEGLLEAQNAAGSFLPDRPGGEAAPTVFQAARLDGAAATVPLLEKPGDRIGRYKLLEKIGEGGCGVVYMADQEEPVRRRVALKVIKLGMDTKQVVARFEAERQALALMDHPNIAKVLDAGATGTGRPYFVMELVRGVRITEYCDENELSTAERLELFILVCHAVQHAHQKGIIHRDLKPSNILVSVNDGLAVPKVIDFGIAKATEGRLTDQTLFTAFEQFLGTPAYMSPEQALMTTIDVDTRSDIYSLGVLLYELLTGKTPFESKTLLAAGLDEMRRTIREREPVRPSTRLQALPGEELTTAAKRRRIEALRLVHLFSGDLDWIAMKCLEKDRSRRYENANGLALDIKRHLNNESVVARPPSRLYELQKTVRRHRWGFAVTAVVAAALVLGATVSSWQAYRATKAEGEQKRLGSLAQANADHLHRTVVRQYVANGTRLMNDGDLFGSLLWFAEALRLDAGDPAREEPHRIRIASVLRQCPKLLNVFAHGTSLSHSEFSPDGERVVTASDDHTARVWDATAGSELFRLRHDGEVYHAAFSPDGGRIVTSSQDKTARLWDSRTGALLYSLPHTDTVWRSCFSPDGQRLATACQDGTAQIWDTTTGQRLGASLRHDNPVVLVNFSPDGKLLGTRTEGDGSVIIWDFATEQQRLQCPHTASHAQVVFSPDSARCFTSDNDLLRTWDLRTFTEACAPIKLGLNMIDLSLSTDGRLLAAAGDLAAQIWDTTTWKPLFTPPVRHEGVLTDASISPDGRCFVTAGNDAVVRLWSTAAGQPVAPPLKLILHGKETAFNSDGRRILARSCDQAARVWDMATADIATPARPIFENELRFISPDGRRVLRFGDSNTVWITDTKTGARLAGLPHTNLLTYASFSRNGRSVITASRPGHEDIFLWDAASGRRLNAQPMSHEAWLLYVAFSPDNQRLLTCGFDFYARLWNANTGEPLSLPLRHGQRVSWGGFSPDGKSVVTAAWDKTVRVWDSSNGKPITPPLLHRAPVVGAVWSADGRRLHTLTEDDYLQTWDVANGQPLTPSRKTSPLNGRSKLSAISVLQEELPRDERPAADLLHLSQMLAVGRIDEDGNVVPLQLAELTQITRDLRAKYQFASTPAEAFAWHRREAAASRDEGNLKAALFHIDRALAKQQDSALAQERAELADALAQTNWLKGSHSFESQFPERSPAAKKEQVDLSRFYNVTFEELDLAGLSAGLQTLGGVLFDARGVLQLSGRASQREGGTYPERVEGIPVGQKCQRLHLLGASSWDSPDRAQLGSFVLHYADGQTRTLKILQGEDTANWVFQPMPPLHESGSAWVVWTGVNRMAARQVNLIGLYKSTRPNPRPDVELTSIDFISSMSEGAPFLVALTVE